MSPRRYRLGRRKEAADQTRERILSAARELLTAEGGFAEFTIDAVAKQAGVARMTVYYQFGSKAGLLEALCDSLALRGGIEQLAGAFQCPEPLEALDEFIGVFCGFWDSERLMARRVVGLAALDPDFEQVVGARQERRREGLRVLLRRVAARHGQPSRKGFAETVDVLHTLTAFPTFDALAGPERGREEVASLLRKLARAALGLKDDA
jgi:AcrR family transcriptional regulator